MSFSAGKSNQMDIFGYRFLTALLCLHHFTEAYNENEPLFLTPLIESGDTNKARELSRVGSLQGIDANVESYSGYFTVNKIAQSNMFFWFFPAQEKPQEAPICLWLQGGPGVSSLFGLFNLNGPLKIIKNGSAQLRKITWNKQISMLYIDNPVGAGLSFTRDETGYAKNFTDVARDLYSALQQFFTVFQEYRKNDFYVTGESVAGKFIPAITHKIYQEGSKSNINLKGMAIGDGLCDPPTMMNYGDYLFQVGLIDANQADHFRSEEEKIRNLLRDEKYFDAYEAFRILLRGQQGDRTNSFFANVTGYKLTYSVLLAEKPQQLQYFKKFLNSKRTRKAIHVGNFTLNSASIVEQHLKFQFMVSVKPWITEIMNAGYKVLIYNGQLDIIVPYPLTASFVASIPWNGATNYKNSPRVIWKLPGSTQPAGYVRSAANFTEVMVRNAGHLVPFDQPEAAYDMITRFVFDRSFQ